MSRSRLAEEALERLAPYLKDTKAREGWTAKAALPGGNLPAAPTITKANG